MTEAVECKDMQAVYERLTRLEERGAARDERMARMEGAMVKLVERVEVIGQDVRDAKTGLRIGLWISGTLVPFLAGAAGWVAHNFWPGK